MHVGPGGAITHTSEQAAASADELEDSYATEAAEEYAAREGKHDQS